MATDAGTKESTVSLGDDPVEHLVPDAPGRYVIRLTAPDGEHDLTVRAFRETPPSGTHTSGRSAVIAASPAVEVAQVTRERRVHLGRDSGDEDGGGGQPRLTLRPEIEGDEAVVRADCSPHPEGTETAGDLTVEFLLDDRTTSTPTR